MTIFTRFGFGTLVLTLFIVNTIQIISSFPYSSEIPKFTKKSEWRPKNALQYILDSKPRIQLDPNTGKVSRFQLKSIESSAPRAFSATKFSEYPIQSPSVTDSSLNSPSEDSNLSKNIPDIPGIPEDSITSTMMPAVETHIISSSDIGPSRDLTGIVRLPPLSPDIWDSFGNSDDPKAPLSILEQYRHNFGV